MTFNRIPTWTLSGTRLRPQPPVWQINCKEQSPFRVLLTILLLILSTACTVSPASTPEGAAPARPTGEATPIEAGQPGQSTGSEEISVVTPTPLPTATPGRLQEVVSVITNETGLNRIRFLGLTPETWINLTISLLLFSLGLLVGIPVIYKLLGILVRLTPTRRDEMLLETFRGEIKWFLAVLITQYATSRLADLPAGWKHWLDQLYFAAKAVILANIAWKVLNLALGFYQRRISEEKRALQQQSFLAFIRGVSGVLLVIITGTAVLNNYGYNVTIPLAILGLIGFAISIAAQDTLIDVIDGFIILFDRPFTIGDRIGIQELDTWGDVVEIGTRTTRIRTRDNRLVIIPNSKIGRNLVVNYSYPDPVYRIETTLGIAYGSDLDQIRQVIASTIRMIEGVLDDKPIDVLLDEFGDFTLRIRVRWWINSYTDMRHMMNQVHSALYRSLDEVKIEMPFPTYEVKVTYENQNSKG